MKILIFLEWIDIRFNLKSKYRTQSNKDIYLISDHYFSLTNYGKTWYEKNFNAYIGDTVKRNKYRQIIDTFLLVFGTNPSI